MSSRFLRGLAAKLPLGWQRELRRLNFARKIRRGRFLTEEPEYALLAELLQPGDWVIDIGANVGHYTARMSELVGRDGRVIAFEPVADTFATLAWNLRTAGHECNNVSLFNAAVSDRCGVVGMRIPSYESGLTNYYQAEVCDAESSLNCTSLAVAIDEFALGHRVGLVKIDVEGHEVAVLAGMKNLLQRDRPTVILETGSDAIRAEFEAAGYLVERLPGSPNLLCRRREDRTGKR